MQRVQATKHCSRGENSVKKWKKWRGSSLKASNTFVNILRYFTLSNRENLAIDARKEMKDEPATKFPASVTAAIPPTAAA
jgi:hypothetical protein